MKVIRLHPGKERALARRHPWVFAGAIARGGADFGETVRVEAADGAFLAWAAGVRHLGPQNGGFCRVAFIWIKGLHAISGARL